MDENNTYDEEYIEIDLKEYLYILYKNKIMIIAVILLALVGSFLFSKYVMTNIYSVESTVRLTNLESSIYSEGGTVSRIIKSRSFLQNVNQEFDMNLEEDYLDRLLSEGNNFLTVNGNDDSPFIEINVRGEEPEKITKLTNNITNLFINESEQNVRTKEKVLRDQLNSLQQEKKNISDLNGNINDLLENISVKESESQVEFSYLQNTLFDIKNSVNEYSMETTNQIYEIRNELNNINQAYLVEAAETPENPSEPNIKLNVAIATVLGLFLAIFIVFIKEFLKGTDWSQYENNN